MIASDIDGIVDFPWEVLEYMSWLRQRTASGEGDGSYLFDEPRVRFEPLDEDVLVQDAGARIDEQQGQLRISSARAPSGLHLDGIDASDRLASIELLSLIDGRRTLAEIRFLAASRAALLDALLVRLFGKLVFAPLALLATERAVSGIEITRFPGSPYEIARPYWQNMAAVRARAARLSASLDSDARFLRALRELHVVALMGEDLRTYYQPQSPISSGRAAPGRLMLAPSVVVDGLDVCVFVRGPRVRAALLGGLAYHTALYQSLGEPAASSPRRFADDDGLDWGRIVHAQAAADAAPEDWFCPPRPLRREHVAALRRGLSQALESAARGDRSACTDALARFHRAFVRLHPFHCGNQSIAMNIVNGVLEPLLGAGMPHLMLDHLAIRLSAAAYSRVFGRAVDAYVDARAALPERYLRLARGRARIFALTERLSRAGSAENVRGLIEAEPESARLLLLID